MDCTDYKRLYSKYTAFPLDEDARGSEEGDAHIEHLHACETCSDWTLKKRVEARGANVDDYPCVHIAYRVTEKLESRLDDPFNDPDIVIWRFEDTGEYGLPIRDGGTSMVVLKYCPWCAAPLS